MYKLLQPLVLASASPRRRELLEGCGFNFEIVCSDIDETVKPGEAPDKLVVRLAEEKAKAVVPQSNGAFILAADTEVVLNGRIFGKPASNADSIEMLGLLSGQTHQVLGGIAVFNPHSQLILSAISETLVTFRLLDDSEIRGYADTSEPYDKAGGYAAQGLGASFIRSIKGSYSNVVGLDLSLTLDLFKKLGILQ